MLGFAAPNKPRTHLLKVFGKIFPNQRLGYRAISRAPRTGLDPVTSSLTERRSAN